MMKRKNYKRMARITSMLLCCTILFYSAHTPAFAYGQDSAAVAALDESGKNGLDLSKLTAPSADSTAGKYIIDKGSVTLQGFDWMITKESDTHFTLRIPGVNKGTRLPWDDFVGIFGGVGFSAKSDHKDVYQNNPNLKAEWSSDFDELQAVADANDGNMPVGTYEMEFKLSKLGGTLNSADFPDPKKEDFIFQRDDGSYTDAFTLTVILGTEPGDDTQFDKYEIQTVSPGNVDFTLFDYWVYEQTTHDHPYHGKKSPKTKPTCGNPACIGDEERVLDPNAESFFSSGINKNHALVFGPTGRRPDENVVLGDWNSPTGTGGASQGIVANKLNDKGYPVLALDQATVDDKSLIKGREANESLEYLFSHESSDVKAVYENANGLLKIDPGTGNYKYSSLENFASYVEGEGTFKVYEKPAVKGGQSESGQFFPFNQPSQVFDIKDGGIEEKVMREYSGHSFLDTTHRPDGGQDAFFNHYFGLTMEVEFQQPPKGKISNAANAKDMTFEFTGDDDVWIFIDDVLVADLGGIHDTMTVNINFATGNIKIDRKDQFIKPTSGTRVESTIKQQFVKARVDTNAGFKGETFGDNTVHELKMFYMERGNIASNLELSFNLIEPRFSSIDKVDQKGDGLAGVEFELYEADENFVVAENAEKIAELTTGEGGSVDFVTYDTAGKPTPIVFEPDKHYVLRESKTLDGFVTTGDIHLTYDENINMLQVDNQWETGAIAGFEAQIYQTEELKYSGGGDASEEGQEGLIFAVPLFNPVHKGSSVTEGWRPLYGSVSEGFHMVDVKTEDAEGYRKAALEAALCQLDNPVNEHWHIEYNQKNQRFEGLLRDLPGSADRYVFVNPTEGDMLTAYYLFSPTDGLFDGCTSAEEKHNRLAEKLDTMPEGEWPEYFNEQQKNMKLLDISQFNRQFYTRLYIPNQVRELRVHKQDESGKSLPGAEFTLYEDEACKKPVAKGVTDENGDMSFSAQNTGNNAVNGGELSSKVQFALSRDDATGTREARSYWLKETAAPAGFALNESVTEIRVTDDSIYANAGTPDNGVSVRKGVGQLIQTMVRYAADDKLNVTLRDILATKYTYQNVPGKDLPDFDTWTAAQDEKPLSLHYGLKSALLDYGLHDSGRKPYFTTDEGWLGFGVEQNYDAHRNDGSEWALAGGTKEDIQNKNISALLTGTTTVVVTDKEKPPEPETGKLTVSKTVSGSAASESERFTFAILLTDNSNTPVSGSYSYTGGSLEGVTAPAAGKLNVGADGKARIELSHGQSITISGLPVGTKYSVEENSYKGYTAETPDGTTGTIQKDAESKVSFVNHKINGGDDPTVDVTVKKVWKLDDGGVAAESVAMTLFKNGEQYDTVVLNSQNGWTHTWPNLDRGDHWDVQEVDVPAGFTASTVQNGSNFTITNDDIDLPDPTDPTDPPDSGVPRTGDDSRLTLWFILMVVSGFGLTVILVYFKKEKCKSKYLK